MQMADALKRREFHNKNWKVNAKNQHKLNIIK